LRLAGRVLLFISACIVTSGCTSLRYYRQAIHGEYEILAHRQSIDKLVASPQTPEKLKQQLQLVQRLLAFANTDLHLPVDHSYSKYVDVHRKYVVWDVQAAPEFSLTPKTWWYPVLGRLAYRGYFSEKAAREWGDRLMKQGFDVYVDGVEAYSTLGWFKDPVMNTFVDMPESDLAELLFHELGHQRVFVNGDTDFNEAFATTVGEEGTRRWFRARGDQQAIEQYNSGLNRDRQFVHLVMSTRERLSQVYSSASGSPPDELRRRKREVFGELLREYATLKTQWGGYSGYDAWFSQQLNNAKLNTVANYYDYVPAFDSLLQANGNDLTRFYEAVRRIGKEPREERHRELQKYSQE
jgi:predicted aminopeptidase